MDKKVEDKTSNSENIMNEVLEEIKLAKHSTENAQVILEIYKDILPDYKKANKRNFIIILLLICILVFTNAYWVWTFTQYDFVNYDQSGDGYNTINNGTQGDVNNGTTPNDTQEKK